MQPSKCFNPQQRASNSQSTLARRVVVARHSVRHVIAGGKVYLDPVQDEATAFAPATVANLGPGFDWLGCAVEVRVSYRHGTMHGIRVQGGLAARNLASEAAHVYVDQQQHQTRVLAQSWTARTRAPAAI